MKNIRNPSLQTKDIRKLISLKEHQLVWDSGIDTDNEWVLATLESEDKKAKLLDWLKSKKIENSNQAIMVDPCWSVRRDITFGQLINKPERFFRASPFQIIDLDLKWTLHYLDIEVASFGRWKKTR